MHRTSHNTTAGWKIHSAHHSSDQLYLLARRVTITRFLPADRPVPTTAGIEGMAFAESYKAQLAAPRISKSLYVEPEDRAA
ncbi:MAG: hypothetical protein HKN91_00460 [Acidimicrobiia bacterium]|nr:hypothetical protein [Acidimicrobiia bacterium]